MAARRDLEWQRPSALTIGAVTRGTFYSNFLHQVSAIDMIKFCKHLTAMQLIREYISTSKTYKVALPFLFKALYSF